MVRMLTKSLIKDSLGLRYYGATVLYAMVAYVLGFVGKHFRHHVDNDDAVWFDYDACFERHPAIAKQKQEGD